MNKTAKNPVTGDLIKTKSSSDKYRNNYDLIFRKEVNPNDKTTTNPSRSSTNQ